MSNLRESRFIVNSFHAVDATTGQVIECSEDGYISPNANTTIVFANPVEDSNSKFVEITTLVFTAGDSPLKVVINDNEMYPFYLKANETRGFDYVPVYKFKVLEGGSFYYEGLSSKMD